MSDFIKALREKAERLREQDREMREFVRDLDRPKITPCPVNKHVNDMSLTEIEAFETWANIRISGPERERRQRLRREAADRALKL